MELHVKHQLLDHDQGDDWECECGEFTDTKTELKEHIEFEAERLTPEYQAREARNEQVKAKVSPAAYLYHLGLTTKDEALERGATSQELDSLTN